MKDFFNKEGITFLIAGMLFGAVYYNFYLVPRDEATHAIMECMQDLHSKPEYDRCAQQLKERK